MCWRTVKAVFSLPAILRRIRMLERRTSVLEYRVTATDDVIAQLNTATDEIARDLQDLRDQVAGGDAAAAAKFQPLIDRLTALGQDPENPVPPAPGV